MPQAEHWYNTEHSLGTPLDHSCNPEHSPAVLAGFWDRWIGLAEQPRAHAQVAELSGRVAALQMSLQLSAMREFELLGTGEDKPNPLLLERLRACCLVIDVLGFKARLCCANSD